MNIKSLLSKFKVLIFTILLSAILSQLWFQFITPKFLELSNNFSYKAKIASTDNFYNEEIKDYSGEQYSTSDFMLSTINQDQDSLLLKNTFDVKTPEGAKIISLDRTYAIDKNSMKHVEYKGDERRSGYLFAPRGLKKTDTFTYWHINYDGPAQMHFYREEKLYNLNVYVFESDYDGVNIDQTLNLQGLPGVPEKRGVLLKPKLQLWIEPISGMMVKYQDITTAYYYDIVTKQLQNPWNTFSNTFTDDSVKEQVLNATEERNKVIWLLYGIPFFYIIAIILFNLYFYVGVQIAGRINLGKPSLIIVFVIITLAITLNLVALNYSGRILISQYDTVFDKDTASIEDEIVKRLEIYTNSLKGSVGLFNSSDDVNPKEWGEYIKALEINKNYPGIQGIGYSKLVKNSEVQKFYSDIKNYGIKNFLIRPEGNRTFYVPVTYLQPEDARNLTAIGFDMYSEKVRQQAIDTATKTGQPAMSGKVTLIQETDSDVQAGFLIYLPIYKKDMPLKTEADRKNAIFGYVFSPFRTGDFINGVIKNNYNIDFQITDGSYNLDEPSKILYTSKNLNSNKSIYDRVKSKVIYINNHAITVSYYGSYQNSSTLENIRPLLILILGVTLSILILISYYLLASSKKRATLYAEKLNKSLINKEKQIENAKKFDETLLRNIGEGVMAVGIDKKILFVNSQWEKLVGYSSKEAINKEFDSIIQMYDKNDNPVSINDRPLFKALKSGKQESAYEVYYSGKDMHKFPISTVVTPIKSYDGKIIACVAIFRDITDELNLNKAKTEFVSLASHQLKTPQTSINWYAEMLLDGDAGDLNHEQKDYVTEIYNSNTRMVKLIDALLNVSRIDLGTFTVEPEMINIVDVAEQVIKELYSIIYHKHLVLVKSYPDETKLLNLDPNLVRIILQNLISNAVKYADENSQLNILIDIQDQILIKVSNEGIGIPKEQQDKIFQKMFRADNAVTSVADGNGLGLYIVKSIVDQCDGQIWFESEENKSTTFFVKIPLEMKTKKGSKFLT